MKRVEQVADDRPTEPERVQDIISSLTHYLIDLCSLLTHRSFWATLHRGRNR